MKKLIILTALLAVSSGALADNVIWAANGGSGNNWTNNTANWFVVDDFLSPLPAHFPTAVDAVFIDNDLTPIGLPGLPTVSPVLDSAAGAGAVGMAWFDTSGQLDIVTGGSLSVGGFARLGNAIDGLATLNMTGGYMVTGDLQLGYNETTNGAPSGAVSGGSGVINMSGDAVLHAGLLNLGQENGQYDGGSTELDGEGQINMTDSALFLVNGDQTASAATWVGNSWITATGAGESISYIYNGVDDRTEFTVIPEPATLGLVALLGGGILWIRKRFMI